MKQLRQTKVDAEDEDLFYSHPNVTFSFLVSSREKSGHPNQDSDRNKVTAPQDHKEESIRDYNLDIQEKDDYPEEVKMQAFAAEPRMLHEVQEPSMKDSSPEVNPLDRYMQLILQNRKEEQSDKVSHCMVTYRAAQLWVFIYKS
ncbi:hypothetical protein GDO81_024298, partial [Engystomops pustulosus]